MLMREKLEFCPVKPGSHDSISIRAKQKAKQRNEVNGGFSFVKSLYRIGSVNLRINLV